MSWPYQYERNADKVHIERNLSGKDNVFIQLANILQNISHQVSHQCNYYMNIMMHREVDDSTKCPICFEPYEETGVTP